MFMMLFFSGRYPAARAASPEDDCGQNPAGFTITKVMLSFNIARKSEFYSSKTGSARGPDDGRSFRSFLSTTELADRLNGAFHVFGRIRSALRRGRPRPARVDFLTTIDRMIFITLFLLLWLGIESAAVYYGEEQYGLSLKVVRQIDTVAGLATSIGYLLLAFIIIPVAVAAD